MLLFACGLSTVGAASNVLCHTGGLQLEATSDGNAKNLSKRVMIADIQVESLSAAEPRVMK